jgi:voltage-gated potassium channel
MTDHKHRPGGTDAGLGISRLRRAELLARRLDKPMGILGVIFLFVVLGQLVANEPAMVNACTVAGWLFWTVFLAEFLLRAYIARFSKDFWRKSWWQVIFLLVPFLRFFRALQALRLVRLARLARYGSILSAGVRGFPVGRTAFDQQDRLAHRRHRSGHPRLQPTPLRNRRAQLLRPVPLRVSHGCHHR